MNLPHASINPGIYLPILNSKPSVYFTHFYPTSLFTGMLYLVICSVPISVADLVDVHLANKSSQFHGIGRHSNVSIHLSKSFMWLTAMWALIRLTHSKSEYCCSCIFWFFVRSISTECRYFHKSAVGSVSCRRVNMIFLLLFLFCSISFLQTYVFLMNLAMLFFCVLGCSDRLMASQI